MQFSYKLFDLARNLHKVVFHAKETKYVYIPGKKSMEVSDT